MQLYHNAISTCSQKVRMVLHEKALEVEDKLIDLQAVPWLHQTLPTQDLADSEIVMVDLGFGDDFFEQNRSWDDFGTTISGI